ncbi:MAG TPA: xanthine dehydrogenase family protein molybdopterin-binding subunit, partial [Chloroflexota bacterium]
RSPFAHARIVKIDTSAAAALPGVKAVVTAADLPLASDEVFDLGEGAGNLLDLSDNILARKKVLYRGHAIAAVAATNPHIAEEAVGLISVEYEELPVVLDVRQAMREDAPLLDEQRHTKSLAGTSEKASNIAQHIQTELGDVDAGFAAADVVIEREYTTTMVHQGYIEPQNGTAMWSPDGHLTVWTSTQGAFGARDELAKLLRLPLAQIKVIPMEIGGGFGGKIPVYLEPVAALLSRKSGRPVKMVMTRAEVLEATGPTSGTYVKVKMGATRDGRLTAAQCYLAFEAGAYPGSAVGAGCQTILAPYDIPNVRIDGYDVVLNKPRTFAYRAPGAPAAAFAGESLVDELAEKLDLDPIDFRKRNASQEGTRQANGRVFPRIGNVECLEAAERTEHWRTPLTGPNRGRGVASGFWFNAGMSSSASASVNPDGTVSLIEGSTDIGGSRAAMAMQLAETLGIAFADVQPSVGDTDSVGNTDVTGGSRVTFATGWAVYEAGMDIRRQLVERAALIWNVPVENVTYEHGVLVAAGDAEKRLTFKELAEKLQQSGAPVVGRASVKPAGVGGAFATHVVDVEVDPDTGKVQILRYTAVQDAGTAIHPSYVEGQMHGGAAQGIGWALNETYDYDVNGRMRNASLLDYRQPTTLDVPMVEAVIVEVPNPGHPYGVRGVGEVAIVPPLAAIANAIYRATNQRLRELPMSPAVVLRATGKIE